MLLYNVKIALNGKPLKKCIACYTDNSCNKKRIGIRSIIVSVLKLILSDAHFCLPYEKINCCKIANRIL